MALTNLTGFETQDLLENVAVTGTPAVNTDAPVRSGTASLKLAGTTVNYSVPILYGTNGVAGSYSTAGGYCLVGFAFRRTGNSVSSRSICRGYDSAGAIKFALSLNSFSPDIVMQDSALSAVTNGTLADALLLNTWYYIEISVQSSNTGAWEVWINGTSVMSGSGEDFLQANDDWTSIRFHSIENGTVIIDDVYIDMAQTPQTPYSNGAGGNLVEVFPYQGAKAAQTADANLTTNNNTTTSNNWANAAQAPISETNSPFYTDTADGAVAFDETASGGHGPGPSGGAYTIDGTIKGAKFWQWCNRGSGGGSTHRMWYGNAIDIPIKRSADMGLGTGTAARAFVSTAGDTVPTASEVFAMGMETTGARDFNLHEQFAFLLHSPPGAPPSGNVPEKMNSYRQRRVA
jgi:hypothetical protein